MGRPLKTVITTGDPDGIGTEITAKALAKIKPRKDVQFIIWRSPRCPKKHLALIDRYFKRIPVASWPEALQVKTNGHKEIIDISSNLPPAVWVETTAKASLYGHIDALVTAPLSKTSIYQSGLNALGHTEILKKVTKTEQLYMAFIGKRFNVLLATPHLPLRQVATSLNASVIENALRAASELRKFLDRKFRLKPIGVLGLNPHAGEDGLIGREEVDLIQPTVNQLVEEGIKVDPRLLVPDAAFFNRNWEKYSVFLALYHDQGLIPFKMIHGQDSGLQITMGLPFIRTSVDHGTAKDIFGKDKANASSMIEAIEWAVKLAHGKFNTVFEKEGKS